MTSSPRPTRMPFPSYRRKGRVLALQILYEVDLTGHPWREALRMWATDPNLEPAAVRVATQYVAGVLEQLGTLDDLVRELAPAWPVSQLAVVDRNIARLALYELRIEVHAPPKVVINEAVELAKLYGGDASPRFINGVLGSALSSQEHSEPTIDATEL